MCVQSVRLGQEESRILLAPLAPSLISQFVKLQADRSTFHPKVLLTSVADPGCLSRILLAPLAPSLISQFVKLQADRSTFHAKVLLTSVADPG